MMWNGIRENSQKKPLALMKDWAFLLQQRRCHADSKTYPQLSEVGELRFITSGRTRMRWKRTFLKCFKSCNAVWALRNDPTHVSDLSSLRPYSKLWFRGHCHGLQWNSSNQCIISENWRVLGNEMSLCLPSPTVFVTLPSLNPAKVSSWLSFKASLLSSCQIWWMWLQGEGVALPLFFRLFIY